MWLRFRDGTAGEINLERQLYGPVFEPLRDLSVFGQFVIHPEFQTLIWPNGADFAPEFLHYSVRVTASLLLSRHSRVGYQTTLRGTGALLAVPSLISDHAMR